MPGYLAIGYWLLAFGFQQEWLLVVGCWLLVRGLFLNH